MNVKINFKKNVIFSLIYQFIVACIGFILPRFFITEYGSAINGSIATINQITGFLGLLEAGMGSVASVAFYKAFSSRDICNLTVVRNTIRRYYRLIAFISFGICGILAFVLPLFLDNGFAFAFNFEIVIIISFGYFIQYYMGITSQLLLIADYKSYINSITQIIAIILNFAVTIVLVQNGTDIRIVKLVSAIILLIRPILLHLVVLIHYKFSQNKEFDNNLIKQRWNNFGQSIAFYIHSQTDMVIILLFLTVAENSVYSIYAAIISAIKMVVSTITSNFNPILGRSYADSKENCSNVDSTFKKLVLCNSFLINLLFSVTAILIIPFMQIYSDGFDYDYIRPAFAYLFCICEYIYLYRTPYNSLINVCGHFKETQMSAFIEAGLNIGLSVIFVNIWGLSGVIIATAIAMLYRLIYCVVYTKKKLLNYNLSYLICSILISLITIAVTVIILQTVDFAFVNNIFSFILAGFVTTACVAVYQVPLHLILIKQKKANL